MKGLRILISFVLKHSPSQKLSDILLWPVSKRLFKNYTEVVEIKKGLYMHVFGDMPDMVNKTLLFSSMELAWEPATARLIDSLKVKHAVVAGSHIGYYPLIIAHANPEAKVLAFEPNPFNYEKLLLNINKNITPYQFALGDKNETKTMHFEAGQSSFIDSHRNSKDTGEVKIITLDSLSVPVDLMVLDAEGYEFNIMKGAEQTIDQHHPKIIFEVNPSVGNTFADIQDFLKNKGYKLFLIKDNYGHSLKVKESDFVLKNVVEEYNGQTIHNFVNIYATYEH